MKNKKIWLISKLSLIAVFTALCFAFTFINVPLPTGDMVHLGNFIMILAALLLGGLEGGIVGSLGMGIYDIVFFSSRPTTIIRTFILKFLVGLIVGVVFRLLLKKKIKTEILTLISAIIFLFLTIATLIIFLNGNFNDFGMNNSFSSTYLIKAPNKDVLISISIFIPIFSLIFTIGMSVAYVLSKKLSTRSKAALFAVTIAILINILGEFFLRYLLEGIYNTYVSNLANPYLASLATATSKLPGSLVTGFASVFLTVLIYEPVYRGLKRLSQFNDDTKDLISDEDEEIDIETNEKNNINSEDINMKSI